MIWFDEIFGKADYLHQYVSVRRFGSLAKKKKKKKKIGPHPQGPPPQTIWKWKVWRPRPLSHGGMSQNRNLIIDRAVSIPE